MITVVLQSVYNVSSIFLYSHLNSPLREDSLKVIIDDLETAKYARDKIEKKT